MKQAGAFRKQEFSEDRRATLSGAKSAPGTGKPADKKVRIERVVRAAEMFSGDSMVPIGDAVVISLDDIEVVLNSTRAQCFDTSRFHTMGIDPKSKRILVIKLTNHFYNSFSRIASRVIYCSACSACPNEPKTTHCQKAPGDIWPLIANPHAPPGPPH